MGRAECTTAFYAVTDTLHMNHETLAWRLSGGFWAGETPGVPGLLAGDDMPVGFIMSAFSLYTCLSVSAHA